MTQQLVLGDFSAAGVALVAGTVIDDTQTPFAQWLAAGLIATPYDPAVHDPILVAYRSQRSFAQVPPDLAVMVFSAEPPTPLPPEPTEIANRRDYSCNGAVVEGFATPSPIMKTSTQRNVLSGGIGAFNGGGLGNKAILGYALADGTPLASLLSVRYRVEQLTTEVGLAAPPTIPYWNLVVELDPIGAPGVYSIFVFGDRLNPLNPGTYADAPPFYETTWAAGVNNTMIVIDTGVGGPGPAIPPAEGVPGAPATWQSRSYDLPTILALRPAAVLRAVASGDGGMPRATVTTPVMIVIGDSANFRLNAVRVREWELNGSPI